MRILVVGSGGREHALVWKLKQEAEVFCTPGNAGIAQTCKTFDVQAGDFLEIKALCIKHEIDLVVVGPEDPLIAGLADELRKDGIAVFGPGKEGAQLEGSKAFSKLLMVKSGVPTAEFGEFTVAGKAQEYVEEMFAKGKNVAVKASGSALGKGVVVCATKHEADEAINQIMVERVFGSAGDVVIIEECLFGHEFSLLTLVSGTEYRSLPIAQDYKRAYNGDRGPNTGGMGTYSPVAWVDSELVEKTEKRVVEPLLAKLASKGIDYRGVLFSGLMVVGGEPYCLEYNVRFGDPETQTVMRLLGDGFADALMACAMGEPIPEFVVKDKAAITVVMASEGYPGKYPKGKSVKIPGDLHEDVVVFHAGTSALMRDVVTSGGRVLGVSAIGSDITTARKLAYEAVERIEFTGKQFRTDIGA